MNESQPFYILALDGGGARGIYPAQVLTNLERQIGVSIKTLGVKLIPVVR